MWRYGLQFLLGTAAVVGGAMLYMKCGPRKHRGVVGLSPGLVVGHQLGTVAGLAVAGPLGGAVASVAGATAGAVIGHELAVMEDVDPTPTVA